MKTKIKQLAFMSVAFVTSFMVTVTAHAIYYVESEFEGRYKPIRTVPGYINVGSEEIKIVIYRDDTVHRFYTGTTNNGVVGSHITSSGKEKFTATFEKAVEVYSDGSMVDGDPSQSGIQPSYTRYIATGNVLSSPQTIISTQSGVEYVMQ